MNVLAACYHTSTSYSLSRYGIPELFHGFLTARVKWAGKKIKITGRRPHTKSESALSKSCTDKNQNCCIIMIYIIRSAQDNRCLIINQLEILLQPVSVNGVFIISQQQNSRQHMTAVQIVNRFGVVHLIFRLLLTFVIGKNKHRLAKWSHSILAPFTIIGFIMAVIFRFISHHEFLR